MAQGLAERQAVQGITEISTTHDVVTLQGGPWEVAASLEIELREPH